MELTSPRGSSPWRRPGGIAISEKAYAEVRRHIGFAFDDTGAHSLKNIQEPVKVWAWRPEASAISTLAGKPSKARPTDGLAVVGVLPFENQSASREDGYFSDGMTEDLINALSRQTVFRVLGRHSTFCFRDRNDDIRLIARELDANYIVRGSVRRAAKKVRVTAELLAPETGEQLWSERCDRDIDDIFAIQHEITTGLAACITPERTIRHWRHQRPGWQLSWCMRCRLELSEVQESCGLRRCN
jgi:adenylate cyclase